MSKKWKLVRAMLKSIGYTSIDSAKDISIIKIYDNSNISYLNKNNEVIEAIYADNNWTVTPPDSIDDISNPDDPNS